MMNDARKTWSVAHAAGRHAWLDGGPRPPMPAPDAPEHEHMYFLGYMREVARSHIMQEEPRP